MVGSNNDELEEGESMKAPITVTVIALVATAVGAFAVSRIATQTPVAAQQRNASAQMQRESPFACDTGAFTPEIRKRQDELAPILRSLKKSVRELADGYEFEFPTDQKTYQLVTEWAIQERVCCPFFDISVRLDRDDGSLWLSLTGREGTKDFIKVDRAKWIAQ
jgi:hypothetical protein